MPEPSCPEISFVLPAYKPQFLKQAIDSIQSQTFNNWELVIIDDCSPYDLVSIVNGYSDSRISYFRNSSNIGGSNLVRQWNHCLEFATGEWVVLAADDDIYAPEFAEHVHNLALAHPNVDLIRSRVHLVVNDFRKEWKDGTFPEIIDKQEYLNNWIDNKAFVCIGNYAFRRTRLIEIGGFVDFPCAFNSDIATPIAMSGNGVANTRDMLFGFRLSDIHLSADGSHPKERIQAITLLYNWLSELDYLTVSLEFLHRKCIFDYYNQVIKFLPFSKLYKHLRLCSEANFMEKTIMLPRWFKHKLFS